MTSKRDYKNGDIAFVKIVSNRCVDMFGGRVPDKIVGKTIKAKYNSYFWCLKGNTKDVQVDDLDIGKVYTKETNPEMFL